MGRPRKPTAQLKLEGKYRPDRHGGEEPQPDGLPKKPRGLPKNASKFWDSTVPRLVELGLATDLDSCMLTQLARWYDVYQSCMDAYEKEGLRHQMVSAGTAWKQFDALAAKFGLTPVDPAKLRGTVDITPPRRVAYRDRSTGEIKGDDDFLRKYRA